MVSQQKARGRRVQLNLLFLGELQHGNAQGYYHFDTHIL